MYATFANTGGDPFKLNGGHSFIWLLILYNVGAWIKKNSINTKGKKIFWIALLVISIIITWLYKMFFPIASETLISYISPTVVVEAICFVVIFSEIKLNEKLISLVSKASPAAFGVYLIHSQRLIWGRFIKDSFVWIAESNPLLLLFQILGCAAGIFIVCLMIELIRLVVFKFLI